MSSPQEMDERIAENVRRFRTAAGLSQAQLAEALSEYGYTFQQQTILKIEKGDRPLKFAEALAIAHALRVSPVALTAPPMPERVTSRQQQLMNELLEINSIYAGRVRALRDAERAVTEAQVQQADLQVEVRQLDKRRRDISAELERIYAGEGA